MNNFRNVPILVGLCISLAACSSAPKSPDVSAPIRQSLDQAGLRDVSVSQDRDKGVVTLKGNVPSDGDKSQAESIANSLAKGQVVADEIAVLPPGEKAEAKEINSDYDAAIEKSFDAALRENKLKNNVKFDVKNGVITLNGDVNSQTRRDRVEQLASHVPNVQQVVNELQVKDQKATTTE